MRHLFAALLFALVACASNGTTDRVARQLGAAVKSTGDVLELAERDAPELVGALEAVRLALEGAERELRTLGTLDELSVALLSLESALALAVDEPRIALALVAVKAALLQLQASQP